MDRQLSLEFARITEQAALKSARLVGLGGPFREALEAPTRLLLMVCMSSLL